jgi:anthranilate synthase component 2
MRTLVIDNYDSFVYNLVQYVGELGGSPIVYRNDQLSLDQARKLEPDRILISPGPGTPEDPRYFGTCSKILQQMSPKIPTLGVCMGCQGIVHRHDGKSLFKDVKNPLRATRYHSLIAEKRSLPNCLEITAEAVDDLEVMGVRHTRYPIEGVQFHPESFLTEDGMKMIKNFLDAGGR